MPPFQFTATDPHTRRALIGEANRVCKKNRRPRWVYGVLKNITNAKDPLYPLTKPTWMSTEHFNISIARHTPWQSGPRVCLPPCMDSPIFEKRIAVSRHGTELFCGSGNLSDALEANGYAMQRYDRKRDGTPGECNVDWSYTTAEAVGKLFGVSYVHVSPDCSTFSQLACSTHQRKYANDFMGVSHEAHVANGHLAKLFLALRARILVEKSPLIWTMENPEATFHHHPAVAKLCLPIAQGGCDGTVVRLSFCAFGESVRKNTVFVTNSATLKRLAADDRFYCQNKRCVFHKHMRHDNVTVRNCFGGKHNRLVTTGRSTDSVTAFPPLLCQFISNCVDDDIATLRGDKIECENAQCCFNKGHRGLCSHMLVSRGEGRICCA